MVVSSEGAAVSEGAVVAEIRQRDDRQAWDALQQVEHAGEMLIDELLGLSEDIVSQKNLVAFSTGEKGKESLVVELLREKMESSTLINNVYLLSPDQNICVTANGRENLAGITSMLTEEGQTVLLNPADFTGRFRFLSRSRNRLTGDIGCTIISGNSRGTFAIITVRALCQSGVIIAGKGVCHRSIGVHLTKHLAFGEFREAAVILNGGCFFIRLVHRGQQLIQIAAISGRRHISLRFIRGRSVLHGNRGLRCGIFLLKQFFFLGCHK